MNLPTRTATVAALAATQILIAGCSAGGPTVDSSSSSSSSSNGSGGTSKPTVTAPSITTQPTDASVITGASATFTAAATGTAVTYQWKKNGIDIAGATAATYTTPAVAWGDDNAQFTVAATNSAGTATSSTAILRLALSDDQAAFESFALAGNGGVYMMDWYLNYTSSTQTAGVDFLASSYGLLPVSPLTNGPQTTTQAAPVNLTTSLSLVTEKPDRVLKNGTILVVPATQEGLRVTYVGANIEVEELAANSDVAGYAQIRSNYALHTLSGTIGTTPTELANPYNSLMYNTAVLDHSKTWSAGASYVTYTATALGDRYLAFDCTGATFDAAVVPCYTNTTLAAALTSGIHSLSDNVTYTSASGTTSTIGGVPVFVATNPRPQGSVNGFTVEYRTYFQMNGNVYTGSLIKDGTVLGGGRYEADPTAVPVVVDYLNYEVRLNKAANDSIAAAVKL